MASDKLRAGRVKKLLADLGQPAAPGQPGLDPQLQVETDEISAPVKRKRKKKKPGTDRSKWMEEIDMDEQPDTPADITGDY